MLVGAVIYAMKYLMNTTYLLQLLDLTVTNNISLKPVQFIEGSMFVDEQSHSKPLIISVLTFIGASNKRVYEHRDHIKPLGYLPSTIPLYKCCSSVEL